jgi:hypothetical protein
MKMSANGLTLAIKEAIVSSQHFTNSTVPLT